jgi:HEAT repeat protein
MTKLMTAVLALFLTATLLPAIPPVDLKGKSVKQTLDDLLPALSGNDGGARQSAQQKWQDLCFQFGAPGNEGQRAEACKAMIEKLDPKTASIARMWLLTQLQRIGREECVEAVAGLMTDKEPMIREMAVRCLANNPAPEATKKLVARLADATGQEKTGIINALGRRGDKSAVAALAGELRSGEDAVLAPAAQALARIPAPEAIRALAAAREKATGALRLSIGDAYLQQADRLLKEGQRVEASAMYRELSRPEEPRPIRLAALRGTLASAGDDAGTMVLRIFGGNDADAQAIAVAQLETLPAGALKTLAADMGKLPAPGQVLVLGGLAARGEKSQAPVAVAALKHTDETVRRAAVRALGRLGDAAVVPPLLEVVFASTPLSGEAAESLAQLADEAASAKLVAALEAEKTPARLTQLVGILERRKATEAVPALLKAARSEDANLRNAAYSGLRTLAEPKHVPDLVALLLKTAKGKDREAAELAIVAACGKIPEAARRADAVLKAVESVPRDQTVILLPVVGRLGGPQALAILREALSRDDADMVTAAQEGLYNWPDPTASAELLKLAEGAKEPAQRRLAILALVRVNGIVTDYPPAERLATLKKAMTLAPSDAERRLVLEGIGFVRHIDSLRYAVPYLDDKDLVQSACKAVIELAHSRMLREPNKAEFDKALDRAIALCKDKALVERAKGYKQQ